MSETRRTGTDAIKSYKKDALKKLRDTFQKVMRIKKELGQRGLPEPEINQRINKFIAKRNEYRNNKEFEKADYMRNRLDEIGIVIEVGNESGWRWKNS